MQYRLVFVAMALLTGGAQGQAPASPDPAVIQHNREILDRTSGADGVFQIQDDGAIRHVQSGLLCPALYPNAEFFNLLVYPTPAAKGLDVGCDYRRADGRGGAYAKFTIFATKAGNDTTLESAFEGYRKEVLQVWKDAQELGPAIKNAGASGGEGRLDGIRSEEFLVTLNERPSTSQLLVALRAGWIIEVRATFDGMPNTIAVTPEMGVDGPRTALMDRTTGFMAMMRALDTVVGPP